MRTVWSVVSVATKGKHAGHGRDRLIGHVDGAQGITLTDCVGYVDPGAAERVKAGKREVCAWIIGYSATHGTRVAVYRNLNRSTDAQPATTTGYVSYDRDAMRFVTRPDGAAWTDAATVTFTDRMRVA